jgi:hypothetical protein
LVGSSFERLSKAPLLTCRLAPIFHHTRESFR